MVSSTLLNPNRSYQIFDLEPPAIEQRIAAAALAAIGLAAIVASPLLFPHVEAAFAAFTLGGMALMFALALLESPTSEPAYYPSVHYHQPPLSLFRTSYVTSTLPTRVPTYIQDEQRVRVGGGHFQSRRAPRFSHDSERIRVGGGHVSGSPNIRPMTSSGLDRDSRVPVGRR